MKDERYWLVAESNSNQTHYYSGYYESGKPVFSMAIADAVHIASQDNAKYLYQVLNKILPCEIWLVDQHDVSKVL